MRILSYKMSISPELNGVSPTKNVHYTPYLAASNKKDAEESASCLVAGEGLEPPASGL